jgi:hypothetical protein
MYETSGLYEEELGYMMGCCKKGITTLYLRLGRFVTFMSGIFIMHGAAMDLAHQR